MCEWINALVSPSDYKTGSRHFVSAFSANESQRCGFPVNPTRSILVHELTKFNSRNIVPKWSNGICGKFYIFFFARLIHLALLKVKLSIIHVAKSNRNRTNRLCPYESRYYPGWSWCPQYARRPLSKLHRVVWIQTVSRSASKSILNPIINASLRTYKPGISCRAECLLTRKLKNTRASLSVSVSLASHIHISGYLPKSLFSLRFVFEMKMDFIFLLSFGSQIVTT